MKICPSCGSSVRDAAAECPSCEFDFEEGSAATMRGVPPVESEAGDQETEQDSDTDEGNRGSRQTAFGMPTADSRPGRVPDVGGDENEGEDASEEEVARDQDDGGTASIPRDELQGMLGVSESDTDPEDPGGATTSIERDSLDQLVGDLDEEPADGSDDETDASSTSTGRGPRAAVDDDADDGPDSASHTGSGASREEENQEASDQQGDDGDRGERSTEFGMPAADVEEGFDESDTGPAPRLSMGSEPETTTPDDVDTVEQEPVDTTSRSGVGTEDTDGDMLGESESDTESDDDAAEPFNIKGFQETGDSQAADLSDFHSDSDPIEPPRADEETDGGAETTSERAAADQSEEELWSATIDEPVESDEADGSASGSDAATGEQSPPSAASLFEEDSSETETRPESDVEFEQGGAAESEGDAAGGASPAAKASGIVRPKNRDRDKEKNSGSGLIGGGTYMVRGDGEGLEEESDLEEVEPGGIDWDAFENEGLSGNEPETEPAGESTDVEASSEIEQHVSPEPSDSDEEDDVDAEPGSMSSQAEVPDTEPTGESAPPSDSAEPETSEPKEPTSESTESASESEESGADETNQKAAAKPTETARTADYRRRRPAPEPEPVDQAELDKQLIEIGQSMFGTVAGVLLIVFAAMQIIGDISPLGPATMVTGIGGLAVVVAPFVPTNLSVRSVILCLVGLTVLVVVPLFGIDGGFETRHVFGVLGGALTLVAGLFPSVVQLLESFGSADEG